MIISILVMSAIGAVLASALAGLTSSASKHEQLLTERINARLPQTQCGRCTFAGCKPYAAAIARGAADIDQCPPGGDATAKALADLLGRQPKPVDPQFGIVRPEPLVAWIDEPACIGCAKCILTCPVDAIAGAAKFMHTVIASQCTGCELCVAPCPVDCIEMRPASHLQTSLRAMAS